jgi:bifunctional UDP-N-acetylglucosamine pyrophosphorylase/glucosamine-1-phosphate N-acetyltransferase
MKTDDHACAVIILAAGLGTRMKSDRVKILHPLLGKPMVTFPITLAQKLGAERIVLVVGHQADKVEQVLQGVDVDFALQKEQLGTGHAVQEAMPKLKDISGPVVVLCGDVPLIRLATIRELLEHHFETAAAISVLTTRPTSPAGYGRIVRSPSDHIVKIVEEKDASAKEKEIGEINTGIYCFDADFLRASITSLSNRNVQNEYYLTDLVEVGQLEQQRVSGIECVDAEEMMGINARDQLAQAEAILRRRVNLLHMQEGVTIIDPARTYIGLDVDIGRDTVIYPGCHLEGTTQIGKGCTIGPNTRILDCEIADKVEILGFCVLTEARVEEQVVLGPFSHLRPDSQIGNSARIGNFVEVKKSAIGPGSKVNHLSQYRRRDHHLQLRRHRQTQDRHRRPGICGERHPICGTGEDWEPLHDRCRFHHHPRCTGRCAGPVPGGTEKYRGWREKDPRAPQEEKSEMSCSHFIECLKTSALVRKPGRTFIKE